MKILIIDDEAPFRYVLARILIGGGYEVAMAEDGEHGLAMFRRGSAGPGDLRSHDRRTLLMIAAP